MGFTVGQDIGAYEDEGQATGEYDQSRDTSAVERADLTGTLDTSGVAPGAQADLRTHSSAFDRANDRLAERLAEAGIGGEDAKTPEEREAERNDPANPIIENQGDRTDGEILDALAAKQDGDETGTTDTTEDPNPADSSQGDGSEAHDEQIKTAEEEATERDEQALADQQAQIQEAKSGDALSDSQQAEENARTAEAQDGVKSDEEVLEGNADEVEAYAKDHPEQIGSLLKTEAGADGKQRVGVTDWLEKHKPFDPSEHDVNETKDHFASVDDAEVERVKSVESDQRGDKARKGIMEWVRPTE